MQITQNTTGYNHRRYGKPWIARVDFASSTKGDFIFGDWTGDHYNGGDGVLSIDASPGDIIAKGQKDFRQPKNSAPDFYVVMVDGSLDLLGDKGAAYKHHLAIKSATPDHEALRSERISLLARIAEIDTILNQ